MHENRERTRALTTAGVTCTRIHWHGHSGAHGGAATDDTLNAFEASYCSLINEDPFEPLPPPPPSRPPPYRRRRRRRRRRPPARCHYRRCPPPRRAQNPVGRGRGRLPRPPRAKFGRAHTRFSPQRFMYKTGPGRPRGTHFPNCFLCFLCAEKFFMFFRRSPSTAIFLKLSFGKTGFLTPPPP